MLSQPNQASPHLTYPGSTVEPKALVRKPRTGHQLEIKVLKWATSLLLNDEASALVLPILFILSLLQVEGGLGCQGCFVKVSYVPLGRLLLLVGAG